MASFCMCCKENEVPLVVLWAAATGNLTVVGVGGKHQMSPLVIKRI